MWRGLLAINALNAFFLFCIFHHEKIWKVSFEDSFWFSKSDKVSLKYMLIQTHGYTHTHTHTHTHTPYTWLTWIPNIQRKHNVCCSGSVSHCDHKVHIACFQLSDGQIKTIIGKTEAATILNNCPARILPGDVWTQHKVVVGVSCRQRDRLARCDRAIRRYWCWRCQLRRHCNKFRARSTVKNLR